MYIPLYNKSNYSLLSSLLKVNDLVMFAKKNNISSIALTDNNMFATMEFIKKCEKDNIKPIIGLEIILDAGKVVLFAKDYSGYQSLIKLSTIQSERIITNGDLEKYNKELCAVVPYSFKELFYEMGSIYIDLYLGVSNKNEEKEALIITENIVFFRESLYLLKDQEILKYLYLIRDGRTVSDSNDYDLSNHELNISDINSIISKKALDNTKIIANMCNVEFPNYENLLPIYDCDNSTNYLFSLCQAGLKKRLNNKIPNTYQERLLYELKVINDMGFSNYFLVVYDYIKFAKKNNILVGPGRGSAAGSLVAYTLGITDIDPLKYDLLFERFLNPERKTMPDIDTDFPDNKRELVIDYVIKKYGIKRVSGIITFGTMAAKQAIRDVSRVFNIPLYKVDSLCKFIPNITKDKLEDIYKKNESFKARIDSDTTLSKMFNIALKLEGYPRHTSSHAAGIIMSRVDLDEVIPLTKDSDMYLSSYSMEYLEELGLLKMDFLVLKNLTIIDNIINDIKDIYNEDIDFNKIPLDEEKTINIFKEANTCGIFQFESSGMRNFLKKLKPSNIDDIIAAIALFRPGAAVNIDSYIMRKQGKEKVTYLDKSLEGITKSTYGLLIYQEQIMQAASIYAGYTLGEADILRRAMSKKKVDLLKKEEEKFIKKSIEKGHSKEKAQELFSLILNFAGYGFNKSHSVVYSIIAYKMAYLKCHYKTIFFANLLSNVIGSEVKTSEYLQEAKLNNIEILKPTINLSSNKYIVVDNKIVYPISNIKGVGQVVSDEIIKSKEDGDFSDIFDCFSRLFISGIGKKIFETLIYANVFKEFGFNRQTLINNLESLFNYAELTRDIDPSLVIKPDIERFPEYDEQFLLAKEKEVFGFYLSSHPAIIYKKDNNVINLNKIEEYFDKMIDVIVLVEKVKVINTKKGERMAFLSCSDETGNREFTIFPRELSKYSNITKGDLLKIKGHVEKRFDAFQIIVNSLEKIKGEKDE